MRDLVQEKLVAIYDCCDPEQTVDILTKALQRQKFTKHGDGLGLSTV